MRSLGRRRITLTAAPASAHASPMIVLYAAVVAAGLLLAGAATAADRTKPTLADETKARPACVGIVDSNAWADCMAKFKDVRPRHEPTTLQFKDWRT